MINLTRLCTGRVQPADSLRYGTGAQAPVSSATRRPVVVWNITRTCNLHCAHCYSDSDTLLYPGELTRTEAFRILDDLAAYGVKHVLLSGGEPTLHPEFQTIATHARSQGLSLTLSTNGTRLTPRLAGWIKQTGFAYVGISLDGIGETHDRFRGKHGAFDRAIQGIRNCRAVGQKTGLRLTLTRNNIRELDGIFRLVEREDIQRVCFYHLVPSGRGGKLELPTATETRGALDRIMEQVELWHEIGEDREVLTVTQPADGAYLLWKLEQTRSGRVEEVRQLLEWNGGATNGSGTGIANIDTQGNVHPDQFSQHVVLGNVKERAFSEIWDEHQKSRPRTMPRLRETLQGRCRQCRYLEVCGGGFRSRASLLTRNAWGSDPCCYLSDEAITTTSRRRQSVCD
jgi:radical SAM protein with 4Fe4S-binding SPASM domain